MPEVRGYADSFLKQIERMATGNDIARAIAYGAVMGAVDEQGQEGYTFDRMKQRGVLLNLTNKESYQLRELINTIARAEQFQKDGAHKYVLSVVNSGSQTGRAKAVSVAVLNGVFAGGSGDRGMSFLDNFLDKEFIQL